MAPAPRQTAGRRTTTTLPEAFHELGVAGRKTGAMLKDRGTRDEHGMQPIDDIFSSSPAQQQQQRESTPQEASDAGSEDMEIASSAGPGPQTVLKGRQLSIPRSRSPVKTNLRSPARKVRLEENFNREVTTSRKLDFGGRKPNGRAHLAEQREDDDDDEEEEEAQAEEDFQTGDHPATEDVIDESLQMIEDYAQEPEPVPEEEEEAEEQEEFNFVRTGNASKDRRRAQEPTREEEAEEEPELPPPRKRGRPAKNSPAVKAKTQPVGGRKRPTPAYDQPDPVDAQGEGDDAGTGPQAKRAKRGRPSKAAAAAAAVPAKAQKTEPKRKGRPPKRPQPPSGSDDAGETSFMALQKGPPLPKSRGLVSVHHDTDSMKQTRSGRHSFKPLAFWRGEAAVADREAQADAFRNDENAGFVVPSYTEIVRVPIDTLPSKRAPRSKSRAKTKAKAATTVLEEDEELEPWEVDPGTMTGTVTIWQPEYELHPPAEDEEVPQDEEQIAISSDAIETREIKDATFRFAKTLTMPFMGAGVVDLPPGAEKRPKNSRKMHMVFFVHYGKVQVSVNETVFRVSAGGTWFVPRGNYYRIFNDYDNPARLFFSQGCEVQAPQVDYEGQA